MSEKLSLFQLVRYYGCVRCQRQHFEDTDSLVFDSHILFQSKAGVGLFQETFDERAARYGIPRNDNEHLIDANRSADLIGRTS